MNGKPVVSINYEGPIAGNPDLLNGGNAPNNDYSASSGTSLGRELRTSVQKNWPKIKDVDKLRQYEDRIGVFNRKLKVDWTHAGEFEDASAAREAIQKREQAKYQQLQNDNKSSVEAKEKNLPSETMVQSKVEPYEETRIVRLEGWYRLCVSGSYHPLLVEMDIRSGGKMGGLDPDTGDVFTHDKKALIEEEQLIDSGITPIEEGQLDANTYRSNDEERQKELENQVREKDLEQSKAQLKYLHTMTSEMAQMQHEHHNRLKNHDASAKRNYDELVRSSMLETFLFAVITGFQVYTVRKWLLSNAVLGK